MMQSEQGRLPGRAKSKRIDDSGNLQVYPQNSEGYNASPKSTLKAQKGGGFGGMTELRATLPFFASSTEML
jgi:hypothetical protein